jgi:hypothetical protein
MLHEPDFFVANLDGKSWLPINAANFGCQSTRQISAAN